MAQSDCGNLIHVMTFMGTTPTVGSESILGNSMLIASALRVLVLGNLAVDVGMVPRFQRPPCCDEEAGDEHDVRPKWDGLELIDC